MTSRVVCLFVVVPQIPLGTVDCSAYVHYADAIIHHLSVLGDSSDTATQGQQLLRQAAEAARIGVECDVPGAADKAEALLTMLNQMQ